MDEQSLRRLAMFEYRLGRLAKRCLLASVFSPWLLVPCMNLALVADAAADTQGAVVYKSLREGRGTSPTAGDIVKVHYSGKLADGSLFDSSYGRGEPVEMQLGSVIPCWIEGVQKMKPGGKARLICPPETAYGEQGAGVIPPNATLTFEIELIAIQGQPETTADMQQQIDAYAQLEKEKKQQAAEQLRREQELAAQEARDKKERDDRATTASVLGGLAALGEAALKMRQDRMDQKTSANIQAQQNAERARRGSEIKLLENWSPVATSTRNGQPMIEVCIRDHECEDGDILQVSINSRPVMRSEIFNRWVCEAKYVRPGINSVQIYAVNGTGRKGNCSFADVNTGQIRLNGINSDGSSRQGQTQEWNINAGAGSTSSVEIRVE